MKYYKIMFTYTFLVFLEQIASKNEKTFIYIVRSQLQISVYLYTHIFGSPTPKSD